MHGLGGEVESPANLPVFPVLDVQLHVQSGKR